MAGSSPNRPPIPVAVVGAGAFGRNHLRVYRELEAAGEPVRLLAVVDSDRAARMRAAERYGIPGFASVEDLLGSGLAVEAASVCVPTVFHAQAASALLRAGVDVLVEKPLAASLAEAGELIALADQHGRILQAGHLERFNPAVTVARRHLTQPAFFESHRLSIFTPRSLDVDVVLDLMIHDLDVVLSMVDSPVTEVRAVGLAVLSPTTDIANARLEFANGAVANFTASRVSTERVRKLRLFQPHQYLSLDYARQDVLLIDVTAASAMSLPELTALMAAGPAVGQSGSQAASTDGHPTAGIDLRKLAVPPGEPLRLELQAFLESVHSRVAPVVDGIAGRRALEAALAINQAIAEHSMRLHQAG